MPLSTVVLAFLVLYGFLSLWNDATSFVRRLRAANEEINNVLNFEERQRALRPNTSPRSLP